MFIYLITNTTNNKQYVGQTINAVRERWADHKCLQKSKYRSALRSAIAKYGQEVFIITTIDTATSLEELNDKEIIWIKTLNTLAPNGYNLDLGGKSKKVHSLTRKKMSIAKKSKSHPQNQTTRNKISKSKKGIALSNNHKIALSLARKDKVAVRCLNNNIVYDSICAAAKQLNLTSTEVNRCVNGLRKSTHGLKFEAICDQ